MRTDEKPSFWWFTGAGFLASLALLASQGGAINARRSNASRGDTPRTNSAEQPASPARRRAGFDLLNLPLQFEPNLGQTDVRVRYLARGPGYTLFLTRDAAVLSLRHSAASESLHNAGRGVGERLKPSEVGRRAQIYQKVLKVTIEGASRAATISGIDELPGKANYLIGNNPSDWHTNISTYSKLKYRDVYPGIDLVYHSNGQRQLESDFIVSRGANPRTIELRFEGSERLALNERGDLVVGVGDGSVIERAPRAYQEEDGNKCEVVAAYELRGPQQVGLKVATYDPKRPLIIDPVLAYSTYLGGSNLDQASGVAVDSSGNAYVVGRTQSTDFPTTSGALQTAFGGGTRHAFVTKVNSSGTALIYSTYLGGSNFEDGFGVAVDTSGDAYVVGNTGSSDFPITAGAFQTVFKGGGIAGIDAFVAKLNPSGSALIYSTYLGGSEDDDAFGVALDSLGNAYVTGSTGSSDFPITLGAFQTSKHGTDNAYVTKVNSTGSALIYSTYLGGKVGGLGDNGLSITVDSTGAAYVAGNTGSFDFPTTPGAFQTTFGGDALGGDQDAFVAKFNSSGSALVYSTFLSGSATPGASHASAIAVDASGNAYVGGGTLSTDFPTTAGAFQTTAGSGFVTKFNPSGSALIYSTYLSGEVNGIALDAAGRASVAGGTSSGSFPTTPGAFQTVFKGVKDAFITKLNSGGSALPFSTYLGGNDFDQAAGIALDASGDAYVAGTTASSDFPTTSGALQTALAGSRDLFVAKLLLGEPIAQCKDVTVPTDPNQCSAATASVDNGSSDPNGESFTLSQSPPAPYSKGTIAVTLTVTEQSGRSSSCQATVTVVDQQLPSISCPSPVAECTSPSGAVVSFNATFSDNCPGVTDSCAPPSGSTFPIGMTPFSCRATDTSSNQNTCNSVVKVQDTTPPLISSVSANPNMLWPPNHKLVPVTLSVSVHDICDPNPTCSITSVVANEPITSADSQITGPLTLELSAERLGNGHGRVYTLTVTCSDASHNSSNAQTTVTVPHDQGET